MKLEESENFINWKKSKTEYSSFPVTWTKEDLSINWEKTIQLDEVPDDDKWETFATERKLEIQKLYRKWGYNEHATEHYMGIDPVISKGFEPVIENFKNKKYHCNFLKLPAGRMLGWHIDMYSWFVKVFNYPEEKAHLIQRTVVMLEDWNFGQVVQIGNDVIHTWKAGDSFTWQGDTWHGACNFGNSDLIVLQVTHG